MDFSTSIQTCMLKYKTFKGKATRSEYWWFSLFFIVLGWLAIMADAANTLQHGESEFWLFDHLNETIVTIVFSIPSIAVGARRLHDIGKSGWWQLLIITFIGIPLLVYWFCKPSKV